MIQKAFIVLAITGLLASCNGNGQKNISKDDAVTLMNEYFENVKKDDFSLIESYYSDAFYESADKEKWKELYDKIHSTLGKLISIELESWNIKSTLGTSGSGKHFTFIYKNKYENGDVTETIVLFNPRGTSDVKINSHNYNSEAFIGL
jgi:hypothetical protein